MLLLRGRLLLVLRRVMLRMVLEMMRCCRLVRHAWRLLVMLRRRNARMPLVWICSIHAVRVITKWHRRPPLLLAGVTPRPVLRPGGLPGRSDAAVDLVRPVALEVVLRLLWLDHPLGAWFLGHAVGRAHGRVVLRLTPHVLISNAARVVMVAHMRVRGRGRVGARLATSTCSSDAIHIHIAIQV